MAITQETIDKLPKEVKDFFSKPTLYVHLTPEGDTEFDTNIGDLDGATALAYLQLALFKLSLQLTTKSEMQRAKKRNEATLYVPNTGLVAPR